MWWIGIGHAGTLISAILLLMHQKWRTSINRFAEAMTIFAVMCAGMFPLMHMGRPWFFYWLYPFPNVAGMWPQFRSPLAWDVFAVTTYFTVSLVFWYVGLVPDFAALRDSAQTRMQRIVYGILRARLARLGDPLAAVREGVPDPRRHLARRWCSRAHGRVVRLRRVDRAAVARDHLPAVLRRRGHLLRLRDGDRGSPSRCGKWYKLEDFITDQHLDICGKVMLATGLLVSYGYFSEFWMAWYSHSLYEWGTTMERMFGPYGWSYWCLIFMQLRDPAAAVGQEVPDERVLAVADLRSSVQIGMWFERYVIVITLTREYMPEQLGPVRPDGLGLGDDDRVARPVPHPVLPVRPVPADDLDHRDAGTAAEEAGRRRRPLGHGERP